METTNRVYLRAIHKKDKDLFLDWLNDPETTKYLNFYRPIDEAAQINWMNHLKDDKTMVAFMICLTTSQEAVGSISLNKINQKDGNAELTIFIGKKEMRGIGLGVESTRLIVDYGFKSLNLHRIYTGAYDFNLPSINTLTRFGFLQEGVLRQSVYKDGAYHDTIIFGLLKSDYEI